MSRYFLLFLACSLASASAAVSSALSPAITVDTRTTWQLTPIRTKLIATQSAQGHDIVRRQSSEISLDRKPDAPAYLELKIPAFEPKGNGWAPQTSGMGAFHGFEIVYQGDKNDQIYQKIGGLPPSDTTPDREWAPVAANRILSGQISRETRYFKVVFADTTSGPAKFSVRFHSARLAQADGSPVTQLDPKSNVWIILHDRDGGQQTLAALHNALSKARRADQVVTLDWASAATTKPDWKQAASNAAYFRNIGQNLALLLKQKGFQREQVNLVGHGWGAIVAHETASRLGGCNHIIALDPTVRGAGAFDSRSVRLSRVSKIATSIKSGSKTDGSTGNETISTTADYSIRLLSRTHTGDDATASFHHALPVHWCIQAFASKTKPYWPFIRRSILLRTQPDPSLPWTATGTLEGGFDLECVGNTTHKKSAVSPGSRARFERVTSLAFLRNNRRIVARATVSTDGKTTWTYRRK